MHCVMEGLEQNKILLEKKTTFFDGTSGICDALDLVDTGSVNVDKLFSIIEVGFPLYFAFL